MPQLDTIILSSVTGDHHEAWDEAYRAYLTYNDVDIDQRARDALFERLLADRAGDVRGLIAQCADRSKTGLLGFSLYTTHFHPRFTADVLYWSALYVHPTRRMRGIGRLFANKILDIAARDGHPMVYWNSLRDEDQAISFYSRYGEASDTLRFERHVNSP